MWPHLMVIVISYRERKRFAPEIEGPQAIKEEGCDILDKRWNCSQDCNYKLYWNHHYLGCIGHGLVLFWLTMASALLIRSGEI